MNYLSISFTHKNTDIHTREKLAFGNEYVIDNFLGGILKCESINEAVLLSTCNRVEIITSVNDKDNATNTIIKEIANHSNLPFPELYERADIFDNHSAIHHLFSVASSLDSLVIGETQIVGQLKDAFKYSINKGYSAQSLARAFHYAFKCAASVRNATSLGTGSVSVASTAVMKAKSIFKDTSGTKVLVIGAGEMSELAIKHLITQNFEIVLTSRDFNKAKALANNFEGAIISVEPYEKLGELINSIPVLITATSAPYPIIKDEMVKECDFMRYWFDIAVPKDIDTISDSSVKVFYVDDLQDIVDENMALRAQKAKTAFSIVGNTTNDFFEWLKTLGVEPVIKHLHLKGEEIIEKKVLKAIQKGFIESENSENIKKLCQSIMTEFLHQPTKQLRRVSKTMEGDVVLGTVQNMFNLKEETTMLNKYKCDHALENSIN